MTAKRVRKDENKKRRGLVGGKVMKNSLLRKTRERGGGRLIANHTKKKEQDNKEKNFKSLAKGKV